MLKKHNVCGSITESVYVEMGREIISGSAFSSTQTLSEDFVCRRYGVSRSVAREAVKILATKGLIACRPKIGIQINRVIDWNLFDRDVLNWIMEGNQLANYWPHIHKLRTLIELNAIDELSISQDITIVEKLKQLILQMERDKKMDCSLNYLQIEFHTTIIKSSVNPFIQLLSFVVHFSLTKQPISKNTDELPILYLQLLDAITNGQSTLAVSILRIIINSQITSLPIHHTETYRP